MLYILIAIVLISYGLSKVLDWLNNKNWSDTVPAELEGIIDAEKYKRSQEYHKEKEKLGNVSGVLSTATMLVLLYTGFFGWYDGFTENINANPIWHTLLFFGILGLASDLLSMPFQLYNTFKIEEKYGFNKSTVKLFFMDKIKGYLLGGLIGGALMALFVWFYQQTGTNFWLWMWIAVSGFTIIMAMFYTSLILPIFNKLKPLEESSLRTAIETYAAKVGFQLNNIFVMDGSKRSAKANAFFSGLGKKKKIVLYDTLIEKHTEDELVSILAHEVGHYKKKHTLLGIAMSVVTTGITLFILSLLINNGALTEALGGTDVSFRLGLLAFGILYSPVSTITGLIANAVSRKNEFEADNYAKTTYSGEALQSALKRLSVDHLSNLQPHPAFVFFHYSHPPLLQRLKALAA
ncbi:MAG: M48 family metallopeptidase [Bacteroidia bacterium]|nr:M48 family metallopeptidase [Bacteroidia bacterium]